MLHDLGAAEREEISRGIASGFSYALTCIFAL
jgi:hypothetical protein